MYIDFVVVTDALPNPNYSLKNLEGHRRMDIIMRNALVALRDVFQGQHITFHAVFTQGGILSLTQADYDYMVHDEISLAAALKDNWQTHFKEIPFSEFLKSIKNRQAVVLEKDAPHISSTFLKRDLAVFLGAKLDMPKEYVLAIEENLPTVYASLGNMHLLASQAIGLTRIVLAENIR